MTKAEFEKKYKIIRKLAEGGQGEVFLAKIQNEDLGFVREVAIKFFHSNSSSRDTVLNEIKILTMLKHPNICQILDAGELEERYFVVLEYVDGISLKTFKESLLKKGLKINEGALFEIASGCFSALKYAHHLSEGTILHNDVSPHNIMITSSGHLKLIDFGIAQIFNEKQDPKIQGKPAYLPNAVLNGKEKYSAKSEMYSLSVILMELMFGRRLEEKTLKQKLETSTQSAQSLISNLVNFGNDYEKLEKFIKRELVNRESNFLELVQKCTDDSFISDITLIDAGTYSDKKESKNRRGGKYLYILVVVIFTLVSGVTFWRKGIFAVMYPFQGEYIMSPPHSTMKGFRFNEEISTALVIENSSITKTEVDLHGCKTVQKWTISDFTNGVAVIRDATFVLIEKFSVKTGLCERKLKQEQFLSGENLHIRIELSLRGNQLQYRVLGIEAQSYEVYDRM